LRSNFLIELKERGDEMSAKSMTFASFVAPSFTATYSTTNPTNWSAKRAYAHFGTEAFGVNG
jgi:hypothetical protein